MQSGHDPVAPPVERGGDLQRLARVAREVGLASLAAEAERVAERVAEGRFYVVCVGQFKRGKSTLLNALVGDAVLPAGVVPVTSVVTVLRYGAARGARIRRGGRDWETIPLAALPAYVSEEGNPENRKAVDAVEVFLPAPLLESGMCLVDTPGIGSVFVGATGATRAFVPHTDAALVVIGADPPITGEELSLIGEVADQVATAIFVLGKADRLSEAERGEAARFAQRVLAERLQRPVDTILQVSGAERLAGTGPVRDWDVLVGRLLDLNRESGAGLVRAAEERARKGLAARLVRGIDEQIDALRRPVTESEARLDALRRSISDVERSLGDLHYLLLAEQERLTTRITEERNAFLGSALSQAMGDLRAAALADSARAASAMRERTMERAREVACAHLDRWRERELPAAEERYRAGAARFVDLANEFLARVETAGTLGIELPPPLPGEGGFRTASRLFYTELLHVAAPSWIVKLLDRVRPRRGVLGSAITAGTEYLERLLGSNSARIQNDLISRVVESRAQLETDVRARLSGAAEAAEQALERARERQAAGREAVAEATARLGKLRGEAAGLGDGR